MRLLKPVIVLFSLVFAAVSSAQTANIPQEWQERFDEVKAYRAEGQLEQALKVLQGGKVKLAEAPCLVKAKWYEYASSLTPEGSNREPLLRELRNHAACLDSSDRFYSGTFLGVHYYGLGQFDSAFYSFNAAFTSAYRLNDTNQMVLSLSNLAALYSEIDWKVEAISTALRAYTMAQQSDAISEVTRIYLNNNVAGLELDLGYFDRAKRVLADYELEDLSDSVEQIHVLRAVNYARVQLHDAKGSFKKIRQILEKLEVNTSAWIMTTSFAVSDTEVGMEVLDYVHDAYLRKLNEVELDTMDFVSFGLPALGTIALSRRVDEQLRLKATMLRPWADQLPIGAASLSYKLAMAQLFELSDYWQDYWRELEAMKERDIRYASLQSEVLSAFNSTVGMEKTVLSEISSNQRMVRSLLGVAFALLAASITLLFWINSKRKRSLQAHRLLTAENERLSKDHFVHLNYFDEVKDVISKAGKTIKVEVLNDLTDRMERDRPSGAIEIPDSALKQYDLTPTEARVLLQLAYGYRNAEIAQMLNISKSYIHNVRSKLRQKLPLKQNEDIEDFALALRKSYEPTKRRGSERTSG